MFTSMTCQPFLVSLLKRYLKIRESGVATVSLLD